MAKYIRVSTIGPRPPSESIPIHGQNAVEYMKLFWEDQLNQLLCDKPDLIVMPETCDCYPQHNIKERFEYYRVRGSQMLDFFSTIACAHKCYIAYSADRETDSGQWRNTTQIIGRDGKVCGLYDKNYPPIYEMEENNVCAGSGASAIKTDFGLIGCVICFDLNFDRLRRQYARIRPEIIIFSSLYHGGLMQAYWAYSCRTYFIGSVSNNECTIISPLGEIISRSTNYYNYTTAMINLDSQLCHLDGNRKKICAARQKYGPKIKLRDPGQLGCVMLSSETDEFSVLDIFQEFQIETLDDYFNRSKAARKTNLHASHDNSIE